MKTQEVIDGLTILQRYRTIPNGYDVGAEHDVICAYATDRPLSPEDLQRMLDLGWVQEHVYYTDDAKHYDPEQSWAAYV